MKILTQKTVLLSILLLTISVDAITNAEYQEAVYMSDLMKALTTTPSGWSNNTHYCKWNGIVCESNRVVSINLPSSSLTGTLPPNLNHLSNLTLVDFHNNSLTGPMPRFYGLAALETVYLGHNNFTKIPHACFQATLSLQTLNLSHNLNLHSWSFTMDFIDSQQMYTLDLEATNIIDSLPMEMFDSYPKLDTVVLSNNDIGGQLPPSLGKSAVRYLKLNNQGFHFQYGFSGTIDVISSMRFLSQAWLNDNRFTGSIPNMFNSTNLFDLQLQLNHLTGSVPPSLLALTSLKKVSLDYNNLQGPIPVFRKGVNATWKGNHFCRSDVGPCDPQVTLLLEILKSVGYDIIFPKGKGNKTHVCKGSKSIRCRRGKIVSVDWGNQRLTGTISPAFSNLTSLVNLTLAGNNLTGLIPDSLTTLPHLQLLDVSYNNLSGKIPKFSSKVKLFTQGNPLLGLNISGNDAPTRKSGGENELHRYAWRAGIFLYTLCTRIITCAIFRFLLLDKNTNFNKYSNT